MTTMPSSNSLARLAKGLLPGPLLRHLRALRDLDPAARRSYLVCQVRRLTRRIPPLSDTPRPASILFVCHGNIIRSAMAEQLLRRELASSDAAPLEIRSAGVYARPGRPADARAIEVAPEFGVSLAAHHATALSHPVVEDADLIIVMDYLNEAGVLSRFPSAAPKVRLMGEYLPDDGTGAGLELPDPYMEDTAAVRACFARLLPGIQRMVSVHGLGSTAGWGELSP